MPIIAALLAAQPEPRAPTCSARQLEVFVQPRTGVADFAPRSGFIVRIQNSGPDCTVPALPVIRLRDARGRSLSAVRRPPIGMHPGPVMVPLFIGGGHHANVELGWTPCRSGCVRARSVAVGFGTFTLTAQAGMRIPLLPAGRVGFDQAPARAEEGMAEG